MQNAVSALLDNGERLHLQHGPIDLIIGADGDSEKDRQKAFEAASKRFETVLDGLVGEMQFLWSQLDLDVEIPKDPVAKRMYNASLPYCSHVFLTPMIAVAGAVADEILEAMIAAQPLHRAYVNNRGDIALHLEDGWEYSVQIATEKGVKRWEMHLDDDFIKGIATSGTGGRSQSLGIADSVTVLAGNAANADAAATLIANAIDIPNHPGIKRTPANEIKVDSDLGDRLVVTEVPELTMDEIKVAINGGFRIAEYMRHREKIICAILVLQDATMVVGNIFENTAD